MDLPLWIELKLTAQHTRPRLDILCNYMVRATLHGCCYGGTPALVCHGKVAGTTVTMRAARGCGSSCLSHISPGLSFPPVRADRLGCFGRSSSCLFVFKQ